MHRSACRAEHMGLRIDLRLEDRVIDLALEGIALHALRELAIAGAGVALLPQCYVRATI